MQAKGQLLLAGKSPTADEFSSKCIGVGLNVLSFSPGSQLWPQLPSLRAIWFSSGQLRGLPDPSCPCSEGPHGTETWSVRSPSPLSPDRSLGLAVSWGNMECSGSENTQGLPLPTHFPSGLQRFLKCEWKVSFQSWLIKQLVVVSLRMVAGV